MIRGRHRGLAVDMDRAVLMTQESLEWMEQEGARAELEAEQISDRDMV